MRNEQRMDAKTNIPGNHKTTTSTIMNTGNCMLTTHLTTPPSTYSQSYQPQLTSPLTNAQHQYTPSLANSTPQYTSTSQLQHPPQFSSPLVSPQPQFGSQFATIQPQLTPPRSQPQFASLFTSSQSTPHATTSGLPMALPIRQKANTTSLSSSEISKQGLVTTEVFFNRHRNLKGESRAGMLSVKLAREVFFGTKIMSRCTVSGFRDLPGFPTAELGELKQTMFLQFP